MQKILTHCPTCGNQLYITSLQCSTCGLELKNTFEISPFEQLNTEQHDFLLTFLRCRGNLKQLQSELGISYPTAKKLLDELLTALHLAEPSVQALPEEELDVATLNLDRNSSRASEIIKTKLAECGGRTTVYTARGLPCDIRIAPDGISLWSDKLPIHPPYQLSVFDKIVELLIQQGGSARKGNGRNSKLGEPDCDETTVVGYIGLHYAQKNYGDSVYDPVFVLAAVLEWADIVYNERGKLSLTPTYLSKL